MTKTAENKPWERSVSSARGAFRFHSVEAACRRFGDGKPARLPFSIRILLENALRRNDGGRVADEEIAALANWRPGAGGAEISFMPGRVILQDYTGVPCVVDLAALREAMSRLGRDPRRINPTIPCDLVVDHSLQVDVAACPEAEADNVAREFHRNAERYAFLKWSQGAFENFRVIPPATGIIHQVNLERLATGVREEGGEGVPLRFPDSLVGTDSHTTMINGLGIVGWGVGGIEAESAMLGEPLALALPEVTGVRLTGALRPSATATDLVLTLVEMLRQRGVVERFVEYFGPGAAALGVPDRATVANMAPEYGATMGLFPVDGAAVDYYRLTRGDEAASRVADYFAAQGLFDPYRDGEPEFSDRLELDLAAVEPCLAGPKRPQDRVTVAGLGEGFRAALAAPAGHRGFGLPEAERSAAVPLPDGGGPLTHGSVVLAAITSCTNTSNPSVLVGAGLLAKRAVERGLAVKGHVRTSLTPGSRAVDDYLRQAGLMPWLEALGFHSAGHGCATCIGNGGPLPPPVAEAIRRENLVVASVTSGNRNFEGRIHPLVKANYLASPPLVVAYALAGRVDIDLQQEPLGRDREGVLVFLKDLWPSPEEVLSVVRAHVTPETFARAYADFTRGPEAWAAVSAGDGERYAWDPDSTYIQEPPFLRGLPGDPEAATEPVQGARVLVVLGDSITTDHISPAGDIAADSEAARFLAGLGVDREDFNSFGARRGNDRVMARGAFSNPRLSNKLAGGKSGGFTRHFPSGEVMPIYEAACRYRQEKVPVVALAGREYGTGSSRDWAAKGPALLGVRAVLAVSFERIHRSNLLGMGILPLQFQSGESAETLGLKGDEAFDIPGLAEGFSPRGPATITAVSPDGGRKTFSMVVRLDTPAEIRCFRQGGLLPSFLRRCAGEGAGAQS